jgi:hypothetical protein
MQFFAGGLMPVNGSHVWDAFGLCFLQNTQGLSDYFFDVMNLHLHLVELLARA